MLPSASSFKKSLYGFNTVFIRFLYGVSTFFFLWNAGAYVRDLCFSGWELGPLFLMLRC
jgi:hypothetical protein